MANKNWRLIAELMIHERNLRRDAAEVIIKNLTNLRTWDLDEEGRTNIINNAISILEKVEESSDDRETVIEELKQYG